MAFSPDQIAALAGPFDPEIVSWRLGPINREKTKGMALAYIDARDVMRRLDEVCGAACWQDEYPWSDGKRVVCRIGIKIVDEWVWKTDGAGDTDTEGEKGALSDAFKRAAVKWGIGRYLYDTKSPWVEIEQRGNSYVIPDREKPKLTALLLRQTGDKTQAEVADNRREVMPHPRAEPAQPQHNAQPPSSEAGASDSDKRIAEAAYKRLRLAIRAATLPNVIDTIIGAGKDDLAFIKRINEPAYDQIMALATAQANELRAGA